MGGGGGGAVPFLMGGGGGGGVFPDAIGGGSGGGGGGGVAIFPDDIGGGGGSGIFPDVIGSGGGGGGIFLEAGGGGGGIFLETMGGGGGRISKLPDDMGCGNGGGGGGVDFICSDAVAVGGKSGCGISTFSDTLANGGAADLGVSILPAVVDGSEDGAMSIDVKGGNAASSICWASFGVPGDDGVCGVDCAASAAIIEGNLGSDDGGKSTSTFTNLSVWGKFPIKCLPLSPLSMSKLVIGIFSISLAMSQSISSSIISSSMSPLLAPISDFGSLPGICIWCKGFDIC